MHDYDHGQGCSVTGGYVRGGVYIYGDFCSGTLWGLARDGAGWRNDTLLTTTLSISTFGVDESGAVWAPDGVRYAFARYDQGLPEGDNYNIYVDTLATPLPSVGRTGLIFLLVLLGSALAAMIVVLRGRV